MNPESENNPQHESQDEDSSLNQSYLPHIPDSIGADIEGQSFNFCEKNRRIVDSLHEQYKEYMQQIGASPLSDLGFGALSESREMLGNIAALFSKFEPQGDLKGQQLRIQELDHMVSPEEGLLSLLDITCGLRSVALDLRRNDDGTLFALHEVLSSPAYHLIEVTPEADAMDSIVLFSPAALDELVEHLYDVKLWLESDQKTGPVDYTQIPVASRVLSLCVNDIYNYHYRKAELIGNADPVITDIRDVNFWKSEGGYKVQVSVEMSFPQADESRKSASEDHYFEIGLGRVGELVVMRDGCSSSADTD